LDINPIEMYSSWQESLFDAERIPFVLAAMGITAVIGLVTGPALGNANPAFWVVFDKVFGGFGDKLNRIHRSRADLMFRGFIFTAVLLIFGLLAGKYLEIAADSYVLYGFSHIFLLSALFSTGAIWFALLKFYFAIDRKTVGEGAYYAISRSARCNLNSTDEFGISRIGINLAARSFDKGLVAPAIWFLIGGFPTVFIYSTLAFLDWRFGKNGFTKGFGETMLALERLMGFIPSYFSGVLITLAAAFTPTVKMKDGVMAWVHAKNKSPYHEGGPALTAMAYALNLSIGGAQQDLGGSALKNKWVGPDNASAKVEHKHLRRAIYINVMAHLLFVAALCGAYLWSDL
jgi:adenosylcobinamide-phosphate synthase